MLFGLLALLCLNAPRLFATTTPNVPAVATGHPIIPGVSYDKSFNCLKGPKAGDIVLEHPDHRHCTTALQQIMGGDKAHAPMLISRTKGFVVPHKWAAGSCAIYINTADELHDTPVTMPLAAVAKIALAIIEDCVVRGPGLGGTSLLGSWDDSGGELDVVIIGRDAPWMELPPLFRVAQILDRRV